MHRHLIALAALSPDGITVNVAAVALFHTAEPNSNQIEKARRRLDKLVSIQQMTREGAKPNPTKYLAAQT